MIGCLHPGSSLRQALVARIAEAPSAPGALLIFEVCDVVISPAEPLPVRVEMTVVRAGAAPRTPGRCSMLFDREALAG